MKKLLLISLMFIGFQASSLAQAANFTGDFSHENWTSTISGSSSIDPSDTTSVLVTGSNNGTQGITSYTIAAPQSGYVNFNWSYATQDADGPSYDKFIFLQNGQVIAVSDDDGLDTQGGTARFLVSKDQIFGFGIDPTDACCGAGSVTIYDFLFQFLGPTAFDTLGSMQRNASAMRGFFSLQASNVNPGLSYDCSIFDDKGICFSMTARNTSVSGSGIDSTSGVATASYRVNPNIRIGGFVEQMTSGIRDGGIRLDNNSPDYGIFGVWQENEVGEGLKLRAAYRYGKKDLDITRQAIGSAEAGSGKSDLTTQGVQFTASNGFRVHDKVLLSPYAGLRYIKIKRDGYTEDLSGAVTTPLTYDNLSQETTSALLGANLAVQITPQITTSGSIGLEHDAARKIGNYSATSVDNLESIKFNNDSKRTRAVALIGLAYRVNQSQQVSAQIAYREEAYGDKSTTTGMLTYTAGF